MWPFIISLSLGLAQRSAAPQQAAACVGCSVVTEKIAEIDGRVTEALNNRPVRVARDAHGHLILVTVASVPPAIFSESGAPAGNLGGRGAGPGETRRPLWIDASLDDTIRVFESGRVVLFSAAHTHVRTMTDRRPDCPYPMAVLRPGVQAMISCRTGKVVDRIPNPILIRTDSGHILNSIPRPLLNDGIPRSVLTRDLNRERSIWLLDGQSRTTKGYFVTRLSESGVRGVSFRRQPSWWENGQITNENPTLPVSHLRDALQISPNVLAVLIATPRANWRSISVPKTREGYWDRYETVIELVNLGTGALVGSARVPGMAVSIASKDVVATYTEDVDGYPKVAVFRFSLRR